MGLISQAEYDAISEFHFEFKEFVIISNELGQAFDETKVLKNKEWVKLCNQGKDSWLKLKELLSNDEQMLIKSWELEPR